MTDDTDYAKQLVRRLRSCAREDCLGREKPEDHIAWEAADFIAETLRLGKPIAVGTANG